jgi:signal transduction histidine kinase
MDEQISNNKNNEADDLAHKISLTKDQWREQESNHLLLSPGKNTLPILLRLLAIAALLSDAPMVWVATWAALSFSANYWMRHLSVQYKALLNAMPKSILMPAPVADVVRKYKMATFSTCIIWCGLSFLSQIWLPVNMRAACILILNAVMFISLTQTYVDRVLMHRIIAIFLSAQLAFALLRLIINGVDNESLIQVSIYCIYLALMGFILWSIGDRFNKIHVERLDSGYSKLQLIETLKQNKTQLHMEQQALVASNALVQQFYSGAAHDLRQPVYAMQLYTSMLMDDPNLVKVLLPKIAQSCTSINDMFNTLFDYQQTHMKDTGLVENEINIEETFRSLALHFQPIAIGKGLEIRFKPIAGSITMVPLYLVRILGNLITNALRYTNTGGVLVAVRKTCTHIVFEIWDTGIGIDSSKVNQIFDEFYKIKKVDIQNDGLGLGLAIVKQLSARIHGTDISVQSYLGRGSVFKFSIPKSLYHA